MKKCIIVFLLYITLLLTGCNSVNNYYSEGEQFNLHTLLISNDDLPENWELNGIGQGIDEDRSSDSVGIGFLSDLFPNSRGISQDVYRFPTLSSSIWDYKIHEDIYTSGDIPKEWTFKSEIANESSFSCIYYSNITFPVCNWTARYGKIIIVVSAWLIPERMSLAKFEEIVKIIDSKMKDEINK
jgi:hypothetical protein